MSTTSAALPRPRSRPRRALVLAVGLLVVLLAGCGKGEGKGKRGQEKAHRKAERAEKAEKAENVGPHPIFDAGRIVALKLRFDDHARATIKRYEREWVRATLEVEGQVMIDVGVRRKGHRSKREWGDRPALLLDFDRYARKRRLFGLGRLALNNFAEDATLLRETFGYEIYRRMGVPTPRTAWVSVQVDDGPPQLYLAVEPIDRHFLRRIGMRKASAYEGEYGCDIQPRDAWGFDMDTGKDPSRASLHALAARLPRGVTGLLADEPGSFDRDGALGYLATATAIGDFDGYANHHNYYLAHDGKRDRWWMLPWGLDRVLYEPVAAYGSEGLMAKACFADRACTAAYVRALDKALGIMEAVALPAAVSALDAQLAAAGLGDDAMPDLAARRERKRRQLFDFVAGRRKALAPTLGCIGPDGTERDADGDGHGCRDCDDGDPAIHPGATERCNDRDDDCNGLADDAAACPCDVRRLDGVRFAFCDLPMPWVQAQAFCATKGMSLARIDSREQSRQLSAWSLQIRDEPWWIGVHDREHEDVHAWVDGSALDFVWWNSDEPSDLACGEDCGALSKGGKGRWYDSHCGIHRPFICRAAKSRAVAPATP